MTALRARAEALGRAAHAVVERSPFHIALAALATGLALAPLPLATGLAAAAALATLAAALVGPRVALLWPALLLVGVGVGDARLAAIDAPARALASHQGKAEHTQIDARAELLERPRATRFETQATIRIASGPAREARMLARLRADRSWPRAVTTGAVLRVVGSARRPRSPRAGANFDFAAHLRRRGIVAELRIERVTATGRRRGGVAGILDSARRRAERGLGSGLPRERAALARGLVLGQDEALEPALRDDFRRAGLAHLLAASGQNVLLLIALALPALALLGLGRRARIVGALVLIAIYVPLAGAEPSLQRAGVMGAAGLIALAAGRPASRWYALLLAAAVTLALNPRMTGDPGWQLSFAAVVGIVLLAPAIAGGLGGLPRVLAEAIALTLAATLATAPLVAHRFGSLPLVALPANLLALPAVAPVMWIGTLQIALAQLTVLGEPAATMAPALDRGLSRLSTLPLAYLEGLASRCAELPGAGATLPLPSLAATIGAYVLIAGAVLAARRLARRSEPRRASWAASWRRLPNATRRALLVAIASGLLALAALVLTPPRPPDRLTVSFLDVGQGDATLVQHPSGAAILFDGGPPEARVLRSLRAAGVRRLSAIIATHASRDHHGGLREVVERLPVGTLVDGGDGTTDRDFRALLAAAKQRGVKRIPARAGQTLRAGGLVVRVLSPPPRPPGPPPEDPNPRAAIALVSSGDFDLLLSADAESPSLAPLALPDVEAIKVPHHGSGDPGLPAVLAKLRPQVATIEVGRNSYGHPHPATLAALERAVPRVYRTDRHGTVKLKIDHDVVEVDTER